MKKCFTIFFMFAWSVVSIAQQKSYITKTIGKWSFEKFPLHFYVNPNKTNFEKNLQGLLVAYHEYDVNGKPNGMHLTMRANGINPSYASYTYKGQVVYMVSFFPSSNIIKTVSNMNINGDYDGPQISRTLKTDGSYDEQNTTYKDGVLTETNGSKLSEPTFNKEGLLEGGFKFQNASGDFYEGTAHEGVINYLKTYSMNQYVGKYNILELIVKNDSMIIKSTPDPREKSYYESYLIKSIVKVTNSKELINANNNDFSYLYFPNSFSIYNLIYLMKPQNLNDIESYNNAIKEIENPKSSENDLKNSLDSLNYVLKEYEKSLNNEDILKLKENISECLKKIADKKIEYEKKLAAEKAEAEKVEENKKLKIASDDFALKYSTLYAIMSDNNGEVVTKKFINISKAYKLLLVDCEISLKGIALLQKKSEITSKLISICTGDSRKSIEKQLDNATDISIIKKILNL